MSEERVPTLIELIEMHRTNTLPEGKVYKYQSIKGNYTIHKDELANEIMLIKIYGKQYEDKLIGVKTTGNDTPVKPRHPRNM
jgi:hypothetical protein